MPDLLRPPFSRRSSPLLRGAAMLGLIVAIFVVGLYSEVVLGAIDQAWQHLLARLGQAPGAAGASSGPGISGLVTKRSLISVAAYSVLYTSACLLLLALALRTPRRVRLAFQLYGAVFVACAGLVLAGKAAGDAAWAYKLARRLIDFIVSPLPVIILVPLLRWYQPPVVPEP